MIYYDKGDWSLGFVFTLEGSVFPKALAWSVPSAVSAVAIYWVYYHYLGMENWAQAANIGMFWSSFNFMLGFLIVFRTQQAYNRYWQGATLMREARAEWINGTSSVFAFCSRDPSMKNDVDAFKHLTVRLMSLLSCVMFQSITDLTEESFPIISLDGVDEDSLEFLKKKECHSQKSEVIMQWIQQLVMTAADSGVITAPSPIVTRFFQHFSQGGVYMNVGRNLTDIPFPFPYAQMLMVFLLVQVIMTPMICGLVLESAPWSGIFTFCSTFAFWGTNYIAVELESPFGDDSNDLPLALMQADFNQSLWLLLERTVQMPPKFAFDRKAHCNWETYIEPTFAMRRHSLRDHARSVSSERNSRRSFFVKTSSESRVKKVLSSGDEEYTDMGYLFTGLSAATSHASSKSIASSVDFDERIESRNVRNSTSSAASAQWLPTGSATSFASNFTESMSSDDLGQWDMDNLGSGVGTAPEAVTDDALAHARMLARSSTQSVVEVKSVAENLEAAPQASHPTSSLRSARPVSNYNYTSFGNAATGPSIAGTDTGQSLRQPAEQSLRQHSAPCLRPAGRRLSALKKVHLLGQTPSSNTSTHDGPKHPPYAGDSIAMLDLQLTALGARMRECILDSVHQQVEDRCAQLGPTTPRRAEAFPLSPYGSETQQTEIAANEIRHLPETFALTLAKSKLPPEPARAGQAPPQQ